MLTDPPTCIITGRIAGDSDACGDCDPCGAAHAVPDAVKRLLAEKDEWRNKYAEAMTMTDHANDTLSDERDIVELLEGLASNDHVRAKVRFWGGPDSTIAVMARAADEIRRLRANRAVTALSEEEIAALIKEHATVGYEFAPGTEGLVNPETIFIQALGAAHVVAHRMRGCSPANQTAATVSKEAIERAICCPDGCMRSDDCWAPTEHVNKDGAADAVLKLLLTS